ncbi:MAG: helix-turn-helix transcriptional regulator [Bacteroidales bacterium]|nr:helix-turn-helix transcriptional regulator [Bacteroidales bacterium]
MLFVQGCKEMLSNDVANEAVERAILNLLLLKCAHLYPHKTKAKYGRGQILVKNFLLHIEENFHKNLKVADYADMLAITPHHLTQIVKQYTGKTSTELLQEKLIVEIKKLLIHSQLSISEIVDLMHFSDQSYLTKFFKKHTSQTPFEYRRNIHESAYSTKE